MIGLTCEHEMGKSCRRPLHAGRRTLRVLVRGRRRPLLLLVLRSPDVSVRSPNAPCCAAACAHGGSQSMSRVLRACMELRVSPARHGSVHMHAISSPPVVQPDNHMPRSFTARRTSMNACEANIVEALLHAGATRTTGTLLAVPCHSRRGHGEDGVMVAPQSLGALAECPLLRCCAQRLPQHVARAWSSEFRPRGTAAGIRTRRSREMRNGVRSGPGAHSGLGCATGWQPVKRSGRGVRNTHPPTHLSLCCLWPRLHIPTHSPYFFKESGSTKRRLTFLLWYVKVKGGGGR